VSGLESRQITVITPTRGRPQLLRRAIASVQAQTVNARVFHSIVIDSCEETLAFLAAEELPDNVRFELIPRSHAETTGPARAARLRNHAIRRARSDWVAFLDDDNEYRPSHLAELLAFARSRSCHAVHSYRELRNADGTPYLDERDPWVDDDQEARASYVRLVAAGILSPGSCVMKDAADRNGPRSVDTSEWLIAAHVLRAVRFRERYSLQDERLRRTEDDLFVRDLLAAGVRIGTNGLATVVYYIGGYSTSFGANAEWRPAVEAT
jgi:glycosyltransferase involved in cell wall biosynthesis